jgi:hypothetical protein
MRWERELKWGNCQENRRRKRVVGVNGFGGVVGDNGSTGFVVEDSRAESDSVVNAVSEVEEGQLRTSGWSHVGHKLPPVAVHPIKGVTPPTTAPTQVLMTENLFMGV